ncbi:hypothetical protein GCK72_010908 [Caenorhabditis remanei]|uniref:Tyrosine-protein phosphatase domain-containing protein n=1 Tax=Caenorhabditis remanei TaxID=31234 RepID=A0A6A5H708_CAERE|nr:hypothetical protein GCK72_010908 [Caenorhabditis remanei]KAF1762646.1 hypothetical protein GCK72_010908 [Caenorhabditis remanei]
MATGVIILIVVIVLVCIICFIGGVCFYCRKKSAPDVFTPDVPIIPTPVPPVPTVPHPEEPSQPLVNPAERNQGLPEDQQHQERPDENLPPPAGENRNLNSVGSRNPKNQVEQQLPLQQKGDNPTDPTVSAEPEKAVQPLAQAIPKEVKKDQVAPIVATVVDPSVPSTSKTPTGEQERQEELLPLDKTQRGGIEKLSNDENIQQDDELPLDDTQIGEDKFSLVFFVASRLKDVVVSYEKFPYDWLLDHLIACDKNENQGFLMNELWENREYRRILNYWTHPNSMPVLSGFDNPYINANYWKFDNNIEWIVLEVIFTTNLLKHLFIFVTRTESQCALIEQHSVGVLVNLCPSSGAHRCYSTKKGGKVVSGRYTVETTGNKALPLCLLTLPGFTIYTLKLTNSKNPNSIHLFEVLSYSYWGRRSAPKNPAVAQGIIKYCDLSNRNIILQCYDGYGPAGTLFAIKYGIYKCRTTKYNDLLTFLKEVRSIRFGAIQTVAQLTYVILTIAKVLMDEENIEYLEEFDRMRYHHMCMLDRSEHPDIKLNGWKEVERPPKTLSDMDRQHKDEAIREFCLVSKKNMLASNNMTLTQEELDQLRSLRRNNTRKREGVEEDEDEEELKKEVDLKEETKQNKEAKGNKPESKSKASNGSKMSKNQKGKRKNKGSKNSKMSKGTSKSIQKSASKSGSKNQKSANAKRRRPDKKSNYGKMEKGKGNIKVKK